MMITENKGEQKYIVIVQGAVVGWTKIILQSSKKTLEQLGDS